MLFRADGLIDPVLIGTRRLLCVGMGSLGSLTMANLAYPFREIILVDPDELTLENIERHLLGDPFVGMPKVEGVRQYLTERRLDPASIVVHAGPVEDLLPGLDPANLTVVVAADRRRSRDTLNAWCREHGVSAFYGGVYPGGTGGQVMVVPADGEPCYICAEHLMGGEVNPDHAPNYGVDPVASGDDPRDVKAVVALRGPISSIAADMAALVLEHLHDPASTLPQVLIHARSRTELVNLSLRNPDLSVLAAYVAGQDDLGFVPSLSLAPNGQGLTLSTERGIVSLVLPRWPDCPVHSTQVSLADI